MAIEHPESHTRRLAMSVAMHANILTFPQTMIQAGIHDVCFNIKNALCTETNNANPHGQS